MTSDAARARLLAIDDNPDSAELIVRVAKKCGYEARAMSDLRKLAEVVDTWPPHVITLDLCMPQEDGLGLLSLLKEKRFSGALIIVSGQDAWLRKTAARLASAQGINIVDDLSKPIDLKTLRDVLSKLHMAGTNENVPDELARIA